MSTQCYCIMYRFAVLQANSRYMDVLLSWTTWIFAYLISFAVTGGTYIIFDKVQPPQKDIPTKIVQASASFPGTPLPSVEGQIFIYLDYNSQYSKYAGAFVFIGFLAAEVISIGCVFFILRQLEAKKASFSKATYKLHRQLTIALGIQLLMPVLFIVAPVTYGIIMTYIQGPTNTFLGRLGVMYIDLYGASNSVVTLYFVKPYRMFVAQKFKSFTSLVTGGRYGNSSEITSVMAAESTLVSSLA